MHDTLPLLRSTDSIAGLQRLNRPGYGKPGRGLDLNLVYNSAGPSLPLEQIGLEAAYKNGYFNQMLGLPARLNGILATIHPYPTWSEAAKYAAGEWKRAHAPKAVLAWLASFHSWRRK